MVKNPDPKNLLAVFSKSDNTVNIGDFVFDRVRSLMQTKQQMPVVKPDSC